MPSTVGRGMDFSFVAVVIGPDPLEKFDEVVADALRAFSEDSSYAASMAHRASTIRGKREIWAARMDLRRAEKSAKSMCASRVSFCVNPGPCGTGQCAFASEELSQLVMQEVDEGPQTRPNPSAYPSYNLESAIPHLQALRAG